MVAAAVAIISAVTVTAQVEKYNSSVSCKFNGSVNDPDSYREKSRIRRAAFISLGGGAGWQTSK